VGLCLKKQATEEKAQQGQQPHGTINIMGRTPDFYMQINK